MREEENRIDGSELKEESTLARPIRLHSLKPIRQIPYTCYFSLGYYSKAVLPFPALFTSLRIPVVTSCLVLKDCRRMAGLLYGAGHPPKQTFWGAMFIIGLALGVLLGVTLALCVFSLLLWTLQDQGTRKEPL